MYVFIVYHSSLGIFLQLAIGCVFSCEEKFTFSLHWIFSIDIYLDKTPDNYIFLLAQSILSYNIGFLYLTLITSDPVSDCISCCIHQLLSSQQQILTTLAPELANSAAGLATLSQK